MKKFIAFLLAFCLIFCVSIVGAENGGAGAPPQGTPGAGAPQGEPPAKPDGEKGEPPAGGPGGNGGPGGPGDGSKPESYSAVRTVSEDTDITGETIASTGDDENALLVTGRNVTLTDSTLTRESTGSSGGDSASFYGVGAAVLVTGGTLIVSGGEIATDASGGAGAFAYGDGVLNISDTTITTEQDTSGGIHVAGGGTLHASNLTVTTQGNSSAAIRSDRGGGTLTVDGGTYTSNGSGSPAVYVTADVSIENAALTATGSEALCLEGLNSVSLKNCILSGNMPDLSQNDNTWTVILYQSMSGDSEVGKGTFTMEGGTLTSANGGLFYTTNTESEFTLNHVAIEAAADSEYFLRCTGNANERSWGQSGANGADCTFTAIDQEMNGLVIWDSISTLDLALTQGTVFTGAVIDDESCAASGGSGSCILSLDADSKWIVTGDSVLTTLHAEGEITDAQGRSVPILDTDGNTLPAGDSEYTITVVSLA